MRHSEKSYCFSDKTREESMTLAKEAGYHPFNTHHILPRYYSRKYHINPEIVKSLDNAISLERDFHEEIHETWIEADYIFIACALLGLCEEDFPERKKCKKKRGF